MDLNFKSTIVKRLISLVSAAAVAASGFQALAVPAFAATSTESVGDFTISSSRGTGYSYDSSSGVLTISSAGSYTITGSSNSNRIVIDSSGDVELTLRSSTIISSTESPISVDSGNLTLLLGGSVTLLSTADNYAAISKASSNTLKITSSNGDGATTGALKATGGTDAAAIGGDYAKAGNNITIAGGTITAKGSDSGAGIGGGKYAGGSNITITGGTVTASSSDMGAGIGGGQASDGTSTGSNITITGGTVTATSSSGAGIGGGYSSTGTTVGSNITISGGFVTASSTNGAGIGAGGNGGSEAEGKTGTASGITISGGTVTASSTNADGIGVGTNGVNSTVSDIVIYNSSVKASSVPITPVNASEESVYLYEFTDTTEGESIIVDGETVIESVVYHSSSDKSQYIYLPKDSATAVYGGSYYTLSYSEEDGTASFTKTEIDSMEIPNAATLSAFAKMVNNGSTSLNGTVTANIDFSNYADMIGSESTPYAGTFDGGGYTVTVDYDISSGTGNSGLFSYADGGTVQNLKVDGTMDFSGDSDYTNVGGVIGYMNNGTISNVVSSVDITNTADCPLASAGGIVGRLYDSSKVDSCVYEGSLTAYSSYDCVGGIVGYTRQYCSITKCANLGILYATTGTNSDGDSVTPYLGGIIGYINSSYFSGMENCYNYGSVSADDTTYCGAIVGWLRNSSDNLTNNYWLETSAEKGYGANDYSRTEPDSKTAEEFENGEVTYCLNGSVDGGTNWYQNLDNGETADSYPVLSSDHGTVSAACYIYCPDYSVSFYSNITSGTTIMGSETNHTYENGVCKYCGYVEGTLKTDDDGRYLIPDAATLISFAAEVNSGSTGINGILTADIDFTAYSTMIGSSTYPYAGTFDGGGYTITVGYDISSGTGNIGLFSYIDGGTVQNLNVEGTMEFSGGSDYTNVGGVIGYMNNGTISNVVSSVNITNTADYPLHSAGGIVGRLYDSSTVDKCIYKGELTALNSYDCVGGIVGYTRQYCTITNCANLGTLYATKNGSTAPYIGGIIGYINSSYFSGMENCYNYGSVSADDTTYCGAIVGWLRNSKDVLTNNYWLETSAAKGYGANDKSRTEPDSKTADEFSSGVIAFLLNESVDGGTVWHQNIDNGETADSYPVLDSDHGTVYAVGVVYCPGYTEKSGAAGVSNTEGRTVDADGCNTSEHSYVNYVCKYCGEKETSTPSKASDGYYEIYTVPELIWLEKSVNANAEKQWLGDNASYNVRLMADIDLSGIDWTPIGYTSTYNEKNYLDMYCYKGTFDGNGHVIKNMTVNIDNNFAGLFGCIDTATIKNLGVVDSYVSCTGSCVGGISGRHCDSTMTNCYFTGTVKGSSNVGALAGLVYYTGVTRGTLTNCYASAAVSGSKNTSALFGGIGDNAIKDGGMTPSNCYYDTSKTSVTDSYATGCSAEEFAGGKVAYLLNGSTSGGTPWYQTIGTDSYPLLDSSHGTVYVTTIVYCPDTIEVNGYNNTGDEERTVAEGCSESEHSYNENGVCIYCHSVKDEEPSIAGDGYYEVENAPQLYWIAKQVNQYATSVKTSTSSQTTYYVRLVADIDLSDYDWIPIGYTAYENSYNYYAAYSFVGIFDGNGHVIKNMTVDTGTCGYAGLFGSVVSSGTVIQNLGVVDSTVYGGGENVGGIVGRLGDSTSMINCYFTGTVEGYKYAGGLTGWAGAAITNCYASAKVTGTASPVYALIGTDSSDLTATNCYYDTSKTNLSDSNATGCTSAEFESGKVTCLLNESTNGGTPWYQTIGTDSYPLLDSTHGLVYAVNYIYCPDYTETVYSNTESETVIVGSETEHTYENSVCKYCGSIEEGALTTDSEGRYIIPDAATLAAFAAAVNSGSNDMDGIVTADIDFTANSSMIGSSTYPYAGTFDGGGYTITVNYDMVTGADNVGLFSFIDGGTVQNLTVEGDIDFTNTTSTGTQSDGGYLNIGGIAGYITNGTISNVVSGVNITSPTYPLHSAGGIVGRLYESTTVDSCIYTGALNAAKSWDALGGIAGYTYRYCTIKNCANLGTLYATTGTNVPYLGGILGYVNNKNFYGIQNCYNYGSVSADTETYCGAIVGWLRAASTNITNNYWLDTSASSAFGTNGTSNTAASCTAEEFESGEAAYLLNGSTGGGTDWYQNIDNGETADIYPLPDSSHGKVYYVAEIVYCPDYSEDGYSNTETDRIVRGSETDHSYSDGVCEYCSAINSELLTEDSEGRYVIPDAPTLAAFAATVNAGSTSISGIVTADIDFSGYSVMIGSESTPYAGTFDGGGYTITIGYDITSGKRNIGLFGYSDGGTIQNLTVEGYIDFTNAPNPGTDSDGKAGYVQVGGIVGYMVNGAISNVVSGVDIISSKTYPLHLTGGIAGSLYESVTVDSCIYKGNLTAYNSYDALGGIAGYVRRYVRITNTANLGTLYATTGTNAPYLGGIIGYVSSVNFYGIQNCYNYGSVSADDLTYCGAIAGNINNCSLYLTNNYWLDTSATKAYGRNNSNNIAPEASTAAQFESGETAYLLNESVSGGTNWYQTIGADSYPLPDSTHGTVYTTTTVYCPDLKDISGYNNTSDEITVVGSETEHSYDDNSICIYCHCVKSEEPSQAADGYYEIENAAQLYWIAEQVNQYADQDKSSSDSQNAYFVRLVADIDLSGIDWIPIGYTEYKNGYNYYPAYSFIGIFDGNGHVIKNMTVDTGSYSYAGLFGSVVYSGSTIKNLGVVDATVYGGGNNIGGIVGRLGDSTSMTNCYFTGTVEGYKYVGGLTGWSSAAITNCWASAEVTGTVSPVCALIGTDSSSVTVTNCYYDTSKTTVTDSNATGCTAAELESGSITWLLNGSTEGTTWVQTIGTDTYPVFAASDSDCAKVVKLTSEGSTVYANVVTGGVELSVSSSELSGIIIDTAVYGGSGGEYLNSVGVVIDDTLYQLENFYYVDSNGDYSATATDRAFFPITRDSSSSETVTSVRGEATTSATATADDSLLYFVTEAETGLTIKEAPENSGSSNSNDSNEISDNSGTEETGSGEAVEAAE